ncbi:hypothetical protein BH20ACI1_BH20ACI1_27200 [soil metagenome]
MQTQTLTRIKQQIISLDETEKQNLADFLAEELKTGNKYRVFPTIPDDETRKRQLEWLKANREKYAGKYVALVGDKLVGEGKTIREAHEKAKENGFQNPFLTMIYSETDFPFGGW